MKMTAFMLVMSAAVVVACSGLKTRKEAAEEAKMKAANGEEQAAAGPIPENEYDESGSSTAAATGPAPGGQEAAPEPADDPILDAELSKLGIDPNDPNEKSGTPEPGSAAGAQPAAKVAESHATPEPASTPAPVAKAKSSAKTKAKDKPEKKATAKKPSTKTAAKKKSKDKDKKKKKKT